MIGEGVQEVERPRQKAVMLGICKRDRPTQTQLFEATRNSKTRKRNEQKMDGNKKTM